MAHWGGDFLVGGGVDSINLADELVDVSCSVFFETIPELVEILVL